MRLFEQIKEAHQFCTATSEYKRWTGCSCESVTYQWDTREEEHEAHIFAKFEEALRAQIVEDIEADDGDWISHSYYSEGRDDAIRIVKEGKTNTIFSQ